MPITELIVHLQALQEAGAKIIEGFDSQTGLTFSIELADIQPEGSEVLWHI